MQKMERIKELSRFFTLEFPMKLIGFFTSFLNFKFITHLLKDSQYPFFQNSSETSITKDCDIKLLTDTNDC